MTDNPTEEPCDAPECDAPATLVVAIGTSPLDDPDFPGLVEVKLVCKYHDTHFKMDTKAQAKLAAALQRRKEERS